MAATTAWRILACAAAATAYIRPPRAAAGPLKLRSSLGGEEELATPLSDDFDGAVADAWSGLEKCMDAGNLRMRLDFDTSLGDETFTPLKQSLEFARDVAIEWALALPEDKNLVCFFPDAGAAALARKDWKMDDPEEAEVPPNVRVAGFPREPLEDSDGGVFVLCPRAPERDACELLVNAATDALIPVAILNPYLVDMGTTGFGMAGRMFKERFSDTFEPCYYLRTLFWGALARTWPRPYTVWQEDALAEGGYTFIRNYPSEPNDEVLEELFDEVTGASTPGDEGPTPGNLLDGLGKFIEAFQKM